MTTPYLTDKNCPPTEETVLAALGRASRAWQRLFDELRALHPEITQIWNYYADGKSWLLKTTLKSKTIFWLLVEEGSFRVSFYFPARLTEALLASNLSEERKAELRSNAASGKLCQVSLRFGSQQGVRDALTLVALKKSLK